MAWADARRISIRMQVTTAISMNTANASRNVLFTVSTAAASTMRKEMTARK